MKKAQSLKYTRDYRLKLSLMNGRKREMEWEGERASGIEYEVYAGTQQRENVKIGVLSCASKPIFEGRTSYLFTKYADAEVAKISLIYGETVEEAMNDLAEDLILT